MANQEKCQLELIAEKRRAEVESKAKQYLYTQKKRSPAPHYHYCMSYYFWDSTVGRMSKRSRFSVELTDDEYIYLLTEQLLDRSPNTYNRLVFSNPDLAEKICANAELSFFDGIEIGENPYLIIFDELLDDAEAIDGPASVNGYIYSDGKILDNYSISAHTKGRQLSIREKNLLGGKPQSELRALEDIDADKVQKLLGARNYSQMLFAMRSLCTTPSPFDAVKAWLDKAHLSYKESTGQKD